MKKLFLLAATAMLLSSSVAFATGGGKDKTKGSKSKTEKKCPKPCPQPCPPCCDKGKCGKS
jgi:hypothetical protein